MAVNICTHLLKDVFIRFSFFFFNNCQMAILIDYQMPMTILIAEWQLHIFEKMCSFRWLIFFLNDS